MRKLQDKRPDAGEHHRRWGNEEKKKKRERHAREDQAAKIKQEVMLLICCGLSHTTTSRVYRERSQKRGKTIQWGTVTACDGNRPVATRGQRSELTDDNLPNLIKWPVIVYCWSMSSKHGSTPIKWFNLCH